jgi:hypothetical protein
MDDKVSAAAGNESELIELSTEIVAAYVSHNSVSPSDLPRLISDVFGALRSLHGNEMPVVTEELKPAVAVKKSVAPDYIICLEDGKKFKSQASPPDSLQSVPGGIPGEVGPAGRLPHGCAELLRNALQARQGQRAGPQGRLTRQGRRLSSRPSSVIQRPLPKAAACFLHRATDDLSPPLPVVSVCRNNVL